MKRLALSALLVLFSLSVAGCMSRKPVPPPVVAREPVLALALGGGGAKGFAHIGVIKVLESHGIRAKIVTGTSAGSFVGALYASGKTPFELQEIALAFEESDIRDLTVSRQGFLVGQRLQDYVNQLVGGRSIQQFPLRFAAVATAMDSGRKTAFNKGNAGQAVRASCSIPNVFLPTVINDRRYVDGGLVSPVPVVTARDMGADLVIAVDISARPEAGKTGALGILDQTLNIMGLQALARELAQADVVISPRVASFGVADLEARHKSMLEGERAAQAQLAAVRAAIAKFKASPAALQPAPVARL